MESTVIDLPRELREALDDVATRTGQSRAEIIQEALLDFLRRQRRLDADPGWPRSIGMIDDAEVSSADLEDWLEANWRPEEDRGRS